MYMVITCLHSVQHGLVMFLVLSPLRLLRIYNLHGSLSSISCLIFDVALVLFTGCRRVVTFCVELYLTCHHFENPISISEREDRKTPPRLTGWS